jgi:hypothetical protein
VTAREEKPPATPLRTVPDGYSQSMAADRIEDRDRVRAYIAGLDFTSMKRNMQYRDGDLGWSEEKCNWVERQYKRWLFLRRIYEDVRLPPTEQIDQFWHHHILDTRAYFAHTAKIFGYYHHHFPYFGVRGESDREALDNAFERNTCRLFREVFGVLPTDYVEAQP